MPIGQPMLRVERLLLVRPQQLLMLGLRRLVPIQLLPELLSAALHWLVLARTSTLP